MNTLKEQYNILNERQYMFFHYEEIDEIVDRFHGKIPLRYVYYVYEYLKTLAESRLRDNLYISNSEIMKFNKLNETDKLGIKEWFDRNNLKWLCVTNNRPTTFNTTDINGETRKVYGVHWQNSGVWGYYISREHYWNWNPYPHNIILLYTNENNLIIEEYKNE